MTREEEEENNNCTNNKIHASLALYAVYLYRNIVDINTKWKYALIHYFAIHINFYQ